MFSEVIKANKSAQAKIQFLNEEDHDRKRIKGTYVDSEYFSFITLQSSLLSIISLQQVSHRPYGKLDEKNTQYILPIKTLLH